MKKQARKRAKLEALNATVVTSKRQRLIKKKKKKKKRNKNKPVNVLNRRLKFEKVEILMLEIKRIKITHIDHFCCSLNENPENDERPKNNERTDGPNATDAPNARHFFNRMRKKRKRKKEEVEKPLLNRRSEASVKIRPLRGFSFKSESFRNVPFY